MLWASLSFSFKLYFLFIYLANLFLTLACPQDRCAIKFLNDILLLPWLFSISAIGCPIGAPFVGGWHRRHHFIQLLCLGTRQSCALLPQVSLQDEHWKKLEESRQQQSKMLQRDFMSREVAQRMLEVEAQRAGTTACIVRSTFLDHTNAPLLTWHGLI